MMDDQNLKSGLERRNNGRGRRGRFHRPQPKKPRDILYFQVHFTALPSARKAQFTEVKAKLLERLREMIRRGQLLIAGGYPSSLGGMWLIKVRTYEEAERLVAEHPAVAAGLLTYRLVELQDPAGIVVRDESRVTFAASVLTATANAEEQTMQAT